jgi:hypothetical protein
VRSYLKTTLHKKGQVEWLKVKALSSNPSTAKIEGEGQPAVAHAAKHQVEGDKVGGTHVQGWPGLHFWVRGVAKYV